MNIRQQLYKKYRLQGISATQSAIKAGYSENTVNHHTAELDRRSGLIKTMEKHGLTDSYLIAIHNKLLIANKIIGYLHNYKKGKKGVLEKISPDEAISNEFIETPDYQVVVKALELAYKLKGHLKDKPTEVKVGIGVNVNANGNGAIDKELQQKLREHFKPAGNRISE
jgi:hypothetical protein